jgi:hypothetical protein
MGKDIIQVFSEELEKAMPRTIRRSRPLLSRLIGRGKPPTKDILSKNELAYKQELKQFKFPIYDDSLKKDIHK